MRYTFENWQGGDDPPKGWDVSDALRDGWTNDNIDAFLRAMVRPWSPNPAPDKIDKKPLRDVKDAPAPEARTVDQIKPESATVTTLATRQTFASDDGWKSGLVHSDTGKIKPGVTKNWSLFLENMPATIGVFAFDAFSMQIMLMRCPPWEDEGSGWEPRPLCDRDLHEAVQWLEAFYMTPKSSNILGVISTIAERAKFDALNDYLTPLAWDGTPRIARFANDYLGVVGDNYAPLVSERWLISSAARGLRPGCKVDTMPILEGPQGAKKSTALKLLYGEKFFTDNLSDIGSKDAKMEMQGVWGLEVAEMHKLNQAETSDVKKFLTQQEDRFRPPYGKTVIRAPRRVVLNGTINPEGNAYLRDPTGARRFWPLECGEIRLDMIERDRDQLWAEAVHQLNAGKQWWLEQDGETAARAQQEKRTDVDIWTGLIAPAVKDRVTISTLEIFKELGIPNKDASRLHAERVGRIMKKLGWETYRDRVDGNDRIAFRNPNASDAAYRREEDLKDGDLW